MESRGKKSALLFVGFVVAVIVAGYVAVTLIGNSHHDKDVKDANAAAKTYTAAVSAYDDTVKTAIASIDAGDPVAGLTTVDRLISGAGQPIPRLAIVNGYGEKYSAAYAKAKELKPAPDLRTLKAALTDAASAEAWVKAADAALTDPLPLFPKGQFTTGEPLRKEFIPALKELLTTYEGVKIPAGAAAADKEVRSTLDFMITSGSALADKIDARQSYNIDYTPHYEKAHAAVDGVQKDAKAKIAAAIKAAKG